MRIGVLIALIALAVALPPSIEKCFNTAQAFKDATVKSLEKGDAELIIDDLEKVFESYPSLLDSCGAEEKAEEIRTDYPPACSKILAKEAKLMVKIMRLYAEDQEKNQKAIVMCKFCSM
jgi:hypothetical protein